MELLGVINVGDYIPWLAWVSHFNGLDARAKKLAKQFDDFFEGVIEDHINCQQKWSENDDHVVTLENEVQMDFVDILLPIQKENAITFQMDGVNIKGLFEYCLLLKTEN